MTAHSETALPISPRRLDVEVPRTIDQLRQAALAARARSWSRPTLTPVARIASMFGPIPGVVVVSSGRTTSCLPSMPSPVVTSPPRWLRVTR